MEEHQQLIKEADERKAKLANINQCLQEELRRKGDVERQRLQINIKNREHMLQI